MVHIVASGLVFAAVLPSVHGLAQASIKAVIDNKGGMRMKQLARVTKNACPTGDIPSRVNCDAFGQHSDNSHWNEDKREAACVADSGCCWDPVRDGDGPWCFEKTPAADEERSDTCQCPAAGFEPAKRTDCAAFLEQDASIVNHQSDDVRESACLATGCCWQPLEENSKDPWCFVNPECSLHGECDSAAAYGFAPTGQCHILSKEDPSGFSKDADAHCCRKSAAEKVVTKVDDENHAKEASDAAEKDVTDKAADAVAKEQPAEDAKKEAQQKRAEAYEQAKNAAAADAAADVKAAAEAAKAAAEAAAETALQKEQEREEARLAEADARAKAAKAAADAAARKRIEEAARAVARAAAELVAKKKAEEEAAKKADEAEAAEEAARQAAKAAKDAAAAAAELERVEQECREARDAQEDATPKAGTLKVKIVQAFNLPNHDPFWTWGVKPDAFCKVSVGSSAAGNTQSTTYKEDNSSPQWEEELTFTVTAATDDLISIHVFDYDLLGDTSFFLGGVFDQHDLLGVTEMTFRNLQPGTETELTTKIPNESSSSSLKYTVTWHPGSKSSE